MTGSLRPGQTIEILRRVARRTSGNGAGASRKVIVATAGANVIDELGIRRHCCRIGSTRAQSPVRAVLEREVVREEILGTGLPGLDDSVLTIVEDDVVRDRDVVSRALPGDIVAPADQDPA